MKRRIFWLMLAAILLPIMIAVLAIFLAGQAVSTDDPEGQANTFPAVEGTNLLLETKKVPADLPGEWKLIVVSYDSDQQPMVDKWLLPLEKLNEQYPQLAGYYVPLLPKSAADAAFPIIGGMTMAANSDADRARTIVVFTDVQAFNQLVGVTSLDEVQLFLLDSTNTIRWHSSGAYQYETFASLESILAEVLPE